MRKSIFIIVVFLMSLLACKKDNTEKNYMIVLPSSDTDTTLQYAAKQLQTYWSKISGKNIVIAKYNSEEKTKPIFIGNRKDFPVIADTLTDLRKDAFLIKITDTAIFLVGNEGIAPVYAVNTLLEDFLGCIKFTATEEFIPEKTQITFDPAFRVYNPSFDVRITHMPGQYDKKYREWYKLDFVNELFGMYVHTFRLLVPADKYFDKHPEYFSLINGRRIPSGQLCLSNPEVINLLSENLAKEMEKQPDKLIWSVSQNDTYMPCECDNCKKIYEKYGGAEDAYSAAYVYMANQIAEKYPDKIISTLAYEFTRHAPKNIKPQPNVQIMLCDIEISRSKPIKQMKGENSFYNDLKEWSQLTHNIYVWDYVVQFRTYLCPFPNFPVLQENLKTLKDFGVEMIFEQGSGKSWSDLVELKQYILSKELWNVDYNQDSLVNLFVNAYYGNAAKYILNYYKTMNDEMEKYKDSIALNIFGQPSMYVKAFLRPELMNYYLSLMDSAEQAVANDDVLLKRVLRTRTAVDFAWVDIAVNNNFKQMPSIITTDSGKIINPKVTALLDKISDYVKNDSSVWVGERRYAFDQYKEYAMRILKQRLRPNKLKNAKIKLLTKPSPRYPVGEEKAINDGLFGPLNFRNNWLGFYGNDMVVVADFGKNTDISHIEMNFLKDHVSWIFKPIGIKIEISDDGKTYNTIVDSTFQEHEEWFHPQSVPYIFDFDTVKTRYLKISAISLKTCPKWHNGYKQPAWIFVDEIIAQ